MRDKKITKTKIKIVSNKDIFLWKIKILSKSLILKKFNIFIKNKITPKCIMYSVPQPILNILSLFFDLHMDHFYAHK